MSTTTGPDGTEETPAAKKEPVRRVGVAEPDDAVEEGSPVEDEAPGVEDGSPVEEKVPAAADGGDSEAPEATPRRLVDVLTVAVVVLALLASFGLYKWRTVSAEERERQALVKRVADYGNSVADFDYRDLQKSVDRSLSFLTGDALARQRRDLEVSKLEKDWTEKQLTLSSKTQNVYVTELNGNLAGAVLVFDINAESPLFGATRTGPQPVLVKSHLTLGLVKVKGVWMVSSLTPAGTESDGSAVPGLGTGTGSTAPTAAPTVTPTTKK